MDLFSRSMGKLCRTFGQSLFSLIIMAVAIATTTAQLPKPAQLLFRESRPNFTADPSLTSPPTLLSVSTPSDPAKNRSQLFPNRVRFSPSQNPSPDGAAVNRIPRFQIPVFQRSFINQSTLLSNDTMLEGNGTRIASITARTALDFGPNKPVIVGGLGGQDGVAGLSGGLASLTVGGLIGVIAGCLTLLVLATFVGLICYRRRHPTWHTAETDLRVLAAHYGSYWDDKTLPHYQFNDRIVWPGDTHDEMIALDNDAFLKSLEDLGRINSRPSSKTTWNSDEDQRQSTKV